MLIIRNPPKKLVIIQAPILLHLRVEADPDFHFV